MAEEVTNEDRRITAIILGYTSWDDATDYRMTGAADKERDETLGIIAKYRAKIEAAALATAEADIAALREEVERLREALQDIAWPARLPSDGDPTVLRNRALEALSPKDASHD